MTTLADPYTDDALTAPGWPPYTPAQARKVGIRSSADWPHGPSQDKTSRRAMVAWADALDLRLAIRKTACLHWLRDGKCTEFLCSYRDGHGYHRSRWFDHVTGWTRDGLPTAIVAQPYGLYSADLAELSEIDRDPALSVQIDSQGWYGHHTTFVVIRRAPEDQAVHEMGWFAMLARDRGWQS